MERAELVVAVEALLSDAPLADPAYVSQERRAQWLEQLTLLVEEVLAHTDMWGLLPPMERDAPPRGVESLGNTLCFIDSAALYRLLPWVSDEKLVIRVERTLFSKLTRVSVADNRNVGSMSRSWQFLNEEENFNLFAAEGPHSTEFVRELARRTGWPLP
jgi:hypothetical protein